MGRLEAEYYLSQGWAPVPIPHREKRPTVDGWPVLAAAHAFPPEAFEGCNVGVTLGAASGGLVDIDVDNQEARELCHAFLPPTLVFGRASARSSHWIYKSPECVTRVFRVQPGKHNDVQVRSAPGIQTVFPGSVHRETGEEIEFETDLVDPTELPPSEIYWATQQLALAAWILARYRNGDRHYLSLGYTGWLLKEGWDPEDVRYLMQAVRDAAGDTEEEEKDFGHDVESTIKAFEAGKEVSGRSELVKLGDVDLAHAEKEKLHWSVGKWVREAELASGAPSRVRDAARTRLAESFDVGALDLVASIATTRPASTETTDEDGAYARALARRNQGPRCRTGVKTLDLALRGGLVEEKLVVVGGAPGAGKTALVRQIASSMAADGVGVAWAAIDEEPGAIDVRRLQALGFSRDLAESASTDAVLEAAKGLDQEPFVAWDSPTVADLFRYAAERYPDRRRLIVIDSLQTIYPCEGWTGEKRERIDAVIAECNRLSRAPETRAMVVVTSELGRGAYRFDADTVDDLASFKESGSIEYQGHVLLVLRSQKDSADLVRCAMPKNRLGPRIVFDLRIDREKQTLEDLGQPADIDSEDKEETKLAFEAMQRTNALVEAVEAHPGMTTNQVREMVRGARALFDSAAERAINMGRIHTRPGKRGVLYFPGTSPEVGQRTAAAAARRIAAVKEIEE